MYHGREDICAALAGGGSSRSLPCGGLGSVRFTGLRPRSCKRGDHPAGRSWPEEKIKNSRNRVAGVYNKEGQIVMKVCEEGGSAGYLNSSSLMRSAPAISQRPW